MDGITRVRRLKVLEEDGVKKSKKWTYARTDGWMAWIDRRMDIRTDGQSGVRNRVARDYTVDKTK